MAKEFKTESIVVRATPTFKANAIKHADSEKDKESENLSDYVTRLIKEDQVRNPIK